MKRWSLKVKVGAYAAMLIVLSLAITEGIIASLFHLYLVRELDESMQAGADELVRDHRNFKGGLGPTRPLGSEQVIPPSLREHLLVLRGAGDVVLYRSPELGTTELPGGAEGVSNAEVLGTPYRVGHYRQAPYSVQVAASLEPLKKIERKLRAGLLMALPVVGLIVFAGGLWLGRKAVEPVADLTKAARRISTERPGERLPMPAANDEIARLTEVLNESFDRMQGAYEAARRFSADASHQLKTPLSILRIGLDELQRGTTGEIERMEVEAMIKQVRRLTGLIEDLLLLAQVDAGRLKVESGRLDLGALVNGATDDLEILAEAREIVVEREVGEGLTVCGDRGRVSLVLQNLVENAAKYTDPGGRISVTVARHNGMVRVRVANSGAEIPIEEQTLIFERFRRGSGVGENVRGQGLGLNIARELARVQGGDVVLVRSEAGWTEFELRLPAEAGEEREVNAKDGPATA